MSLLLLIPASAIGQTDAEEAAFWRSVVCERGPEVELYLEEYPSGVYVAEAWACLEGQLGLEWADRILIQQGLAAVGHDPGPADGLFGAGPGTRTRQAIRAWQRVKGLEARGYLTQEQVDTLMALGREAAARQAREVQAAREEAVRQAREADDTAYAAAESRNTLEGYGTYLREYPAGRHAAEARAAQRRLRDPAEQQRERERIIAQLNAQMVRIEGGRFTMGRAHQVRLSSFELSKYEITQEVWEAVMGENPSDFQNCPQCPVGQVSWNDIQAFLRKLNVGGGRYRLPSEAEWEYAAQGGQQSRGYQYAGSDNPNAVAWYDENGGGSTHPVGQKQANELGVYDLSGNVREWVQDCWNESYAGAPSDGRAWERGDCSRRVTRGGSVSNGPLKNLSPYHRYYSFPAGERGYYFRIPYCPVASLVLESLPLYFYGSKGFAPGQIFGNDTGRNPPRPFGPPPSTGLRTGLQGGDFLGDAVTRHPAGWRWPRVGRRAALRGGPCVHAVRRFAAPGP